MSMTREEAIKALRLERGININGNAVRVAEFLQGLDVAISALQSVSKEQVEKFKQYFDDLYGKGLEVYGWHMNGEAKSFDDFYKDAYEYAGL